MSDDQNPSDGTSTPKRPKLDYEIGWGKPPKEHQWPVGQSGNGKGRPRGAKSFEAHVRRLLQEKVTIRENGKTRKASVVDANFRRLIQKALAGETKPMMMLIDLALRYLPQEDTKEIRKLFEEDEELLRRFLERNGPSMGEPHADG